MLVRIGANRWLTRRNEFRKDCFELERELWQNGVRKQVVRNHGNYVRTIWDWFAGRFRVPVTVAEEMLKDGAVEQYTPVPSLGIALVKCKPEIYGVYMEAS